jgi:hypothetical protein
VVAWLNLGRGAHSGSEGSVMAEMSDGHAGQQITTKCSN